VIYIYKKQLEEADLIVISKCELIDATQLEQLRSAILEAYPRSEVLAISSRENLGVQEWFTRLETEEQSVRNTMEIDYDVYADGEALLGWLNATVTLHGNEEFDANFLLKTLAEEVQRRLTEQGAEIAHFKMTFSPNTGLGDIAVINLVRNDFIPELSIRLEPPATGGQLIINLRGEAAPETLAAALQDALPVAATSVPGLNATLEHLEQFRPGRPTPTHRDGPASIHASQA
jgi:G3E family GTPase